MARCRTRCRDPTGVGGNCCRRERIESSIDLPLLRRLSLSSSRSRSCAVGGGARWKRAGSPSKVYTPSRARTWIGTLRLRTDPCLCQGLLLQSSCIPAIHGGQMKVTRSVSSTARTKPRAVRERRRQPPAHHCEHLGEQLRARREQQPQRPACRSMQRSPAGPTSAVGWSGDAATSRAWPLRWNVSAATATAWWPGRHDRVREVTFFA